MYDYKTPPGWGDTFFQYVFDAVGAGLVNGTSYFQKGVQVNDGQFLLRYWAGLGTIAEGLQLYDWLGRKFASDFMTLGNGAFGQKGQMVVLPEVVYPENGNIRFDLQSVVQAVGGAASQLVFTGVRRRRGVVSDPVPSNYRYYEKEYSIPYTLVVPDPAVTGTTQFIVPITDFDFELRRMELENPVGFVTDSGFKILMYDTNWIQLANKPVLANQFFHMSNPGAVLNVGQLGFWPCPPLLYRVNGVIRFDVSGVTGAGAQTYQILFKGVRRIPCS